MIRIEHDNNFDLLRLFAASQVVYVHGWGHLKLPIGPEFKLALLFMGVPMFFIISGFLVTDSWMRSRSAGHFLWKRVLRIYPALAANIVGMELIYMMAGSAIFLSGAAYVGYLATYIFTASAWIAQMAFPDLQPYVGGHFFKIPQSGVLWSLTVELTFYLVLPFVLAPLRFGRAAAIGCVVALAAISFYLATYFSPEFFDGLGNWWIITVPGFFWIFSIGILARLTWDWIKPFMVGKAAWWLALYVVVEWTMQTFMQTSEALGFTAGVTPISAFRAALMGMVVLSCAYTLPRLGRVLGGHDFSYGLYLWHMTVIAILVSLDFSRSWWLWPAVYAGGFAFAAASWFGVEKPMLALRRKSGPKPSTLAATAAS